MAYLPRVACTMFFPAALISLAVAQTPPPPPIGSNAPATATPAAGADTKKTQQVPITKTQAQVKRKSIVHHYPYPYPSFYHGDQSAGWRNPGGAGRYREYYVPTSRYQQYDTNGGGDPVRVAQFGDGGIPNRQEQLQAQEVGIQRYNSIQQSIDNYSRPYFGYGMGVGVYGGFY